MSTGLNNQRIAGLLEEIKKLHNLAPFLTDPRGAFERVLERLERLMLEAYGNPSVGRLAAAALIAKGNQDGERPLVSCVIAIKEAATSNLTEKHGAGDAALAMSAVREASIIAKQYGGTMECALCPIKPAPPGTQLLHTGMCDLYTWRERFHLMMNRVWEKKSAPLERFSRFLSGIPERAHKDAIVGQLDAVLRAMEWTASNPGRRTTEDNEALSLMAAKLESKLKEQTT